MLFNIFLLFLVRGGLNECYNAFFSKKCHIDQTLHIYDKDGQYGYIAMISAFPVGEYEVSSCHLTYMLY